MADHSRPQGALHRELLIFVAQLREHKQMQQIHQELMKFPFVLWLAQQVE